MPAAIATLTGDLSALVIGQEIDPQRVRARLLTNLPAGVPIVDKSSGGALHFGPWELTLDAAGKFTQTGVIRTNTADTNPTTFQYVVEVTYTDMSHGATRNPMRWRSTPFSLTTATADLRDLLGEAYAPPQWEPASKTYVDAGDAANTAAINAANLARELTNAAEVGKPAIVADALVIDVATKWGIDGNGSPYFDDAGPTAGQEAVMYVQDGELSWTRLSLIR